MGYLVALTTIAIGVVLIGVGATGSERNLFETLTGKSLTVGGVHLASATTTVVPTPTATATATPALAHPAAGLAS